MAKQFQIGDKVLNRWTKAVTTVTWVSKDGELISTEANSYTGDSTSWASDYVRA